MFDNKNTFNIRLRIVYICFAAIFIAACSTKQRTTKREMLPGIDECISASEFDLLDLYQYGDDAKWQTVLLHLQNILNNKSGNVIIYATPDLLQDRVWNERKIDVHDFNMLPFSEGRRIRLGNPFQQGLSIRSVIMLWREMGFLDCSYYPDAILLRKTP